MSESFGDVEHQMIGSAQFKRAPLLEGTGIRAEVYDDIVDGAHCAAYQLGLFVRRGLIVHTSQDALLLIERDITLHELRIERVCRKLTFTPGACEKAALVFLPVGLNQESTSEFCFGENQ